MHTFPSEYECFHDALYQRSHIEFSRLREMELIDNFHNIDLLQSVKTMAPW